MKSNFGHWDEEVMFQPPKIRGVADLAPYTPLVYHDGRVVDYPELISFYWGPFTDAEVATMQAWLASFASYVSGANLPSRMEPVVRQYGVLAARVGALYRDPVVPMGTVGWPEIGAMIAARQNAGDLPKQSPDRIFLVFTKGITIAGFGSIWSGLHGGGPGIPIALCPFPGGLDPMPQWQEVTSHEILEAATDPDGGSGWIADNGERGATCVNG